MGYFKCPKEKKPPQVLFSKNKYGPHVKTEHWDFSFLTEPKDNNVYRNNLSNHISTYVRMGLDQQKYSTETKDMLDQIKLQFKPIEQLKPMLYTTYPATKIVPSVNDYLSTNQDDFRNPFTSVSKPLTMESPPWLLNRVIRSDLTHNHGTAPPSGDYQCLDTHTKIDHVREMRHFRYQSFNPATCLQNFP